MGWTKKLLQDLHDRLSPSEFEKFVYVLLDRMGFSERELVAKSGDGGVDLTATWTQSQAPGLEIDLGFVIQVKRLNPGASLNPIYLRALKGSMTPGQWGLLITTGRVSARTREEGLKDPSRIVSVIDGRQLAELCAKYAVGVRKEYHFDTTFLKPKVDSGELREPTPSKTFPKDLSEILTNAGKEHFERVGRTSIYKSHSKTLISRWSQRYKRKGQNYWYVLTAKDLESIRNYGITHFAYVCSDVGVVFLPVKIVLRNVKAGNLGRTPKEGQLRHYHISFEEDKGRFKWVLRNGVRENVEKFFYEIRK